VKGIPDGQQRILVARGNFHGRTTTIIGFSSEEGYRSGFGPFCGGFQHFDYGDMDSVKAAANEHTCAVLIEPIQGEAGVLVPPPGFFRQLRDWCTENNVLLIDDEVQAGLGRTGTWFAFQHEGIRPDGLILGKALGGGLLPVSAFCADDRVMQVFNPNSHGSTFGGNALAAAVALEGLKVLEEEGLVANCAEKGEYLFKRLREVQDEVRPLIRDVRGRGLWIGVDIEPSCTTARDLVERLAAGGVLSKETHETVIRFAPPLTITYALMDRAVEVFRRVAREKYQELGLDRAAAAV
jgi:ornithine--oxo-acid transaminase